MKNSISEKQLLTRSVSRNVFPRTEYFRDQTAIIHSMPFRRLKHKTQVFFSPQNDHVCTRIEHVLHVATIAATICKGLNSTKNGWELNEELAYAIGLGHDLGHAPFGHSGETVLNELVGSNNSFIHEVNGYRVVECLANNGNGLNLTYAVKDGIICHCGEKFEKEISPRNTYLDLNEIKDRSEYPVSYEGCIVRFSDKIAYFGRDIEDAYLANFFEIEEIPKKIRSELGITNGDIINTLVLDLIENSKDAESICFSDEKHKLILELKDFNNSKIYSHPSIVKWRTDGENIIRFLFEHFLELFTQNGFDGRKYKVKNPKKIDLSFSNYLLKMKAFYKKEDTSPKQIITDYISGMTDEYALRCMSDLIIPKPLEI